MIKNVLQKYNNLKQRNQICAKAIFFVLSAEICIMFALRLWHMSKCCCDMFVKAGVIFLICGLLFLFAIIRLYLRSKKEGEYKFEFRSFIISKLLANAISPSWIGTLYLFFFVIHIGWLSDASLNLFLINAYKTSWDILVSLLVGGIGIATLMAFFPLAQEQGSEDKTKVFVSGISLISLNFHNNYNDNLTPLVSVLKEANENDKFVFLILHSNGYTNNDTKIKEGINKYFNDEITKYYEKKKEIDENNKIEEIIKKEIDDFAVMQTTTQLEKLINIVAKNRFSEKKWLVDKNFTFAVHFINPPVDYNDFETCYSILDSEIQQYDRPQYQLYFNITPGTGIIGSLMTLMSIKGNRKLLYYPQFVKDPEIKEAMKNKIPLKNLLSQALENYEIEMNISSNN